MTTLRVSLFLSFALSTLAVAETADVRVRDIDAYGEDETSITIKKGPPRSTVETTTFEIVEGTKDIAGDSDYATRPARNNWKEACAEWKREVRETNAVGKIMKLDCGLPSDSVENMQHTFTSRGSYKIRVPVKERLE